MLPSIETAEHVPLFARKKKTRVVRAGKKGLKFDIYYIIFSGHQRDVPFVQQYMKTLFSMYFSQLFCFSNTQGRVISYIKKK